MTNKIFFSFLILLLLQHVSHAQHVKDSTLLFQAEDYYEKNDIDNALDLYDELIHKGEGSAMVLVRKASCYSSMNKYDKALEYYNQALAIDSTYKTAYYYLGGLYIDLDSMNQALGCYRKYITMPDADTSNGLLNMGIAFTIEDMEDSAFYYLDKAHEYDSDNPDVIYRSILLNMQYDHYDKAYDLTVEGREKHPDVSEFYDLAGRNQYFLGNYDKAEELINQAIKMEPYVKDYYRNLNFVQTHRHTDPDVWENKDEVYFRILHSNNLNTLVDFANEKGNKYNYATLLKKFKKDYTSLGLDEYFMLYFGQSTQKGYNPYFDGSSAVFEDIDRLYDRAQYEDAIKKGTALLAKNPLSVKGQLYVAACYYKLRNWEAYHEHINIYRSLIEAITSTGDGKSAAKAMVVVNVTDEYMAVNYLGYDADDHRVISHAGMKMDVIAGVNENLDEDLKHVDFYFNIDQAYSTLTPGK